MMATIVIIPLSLKVKKNIKLIKFDKVIDDSIVTSFYYIFRLTVTNGPVLMPPCIQIRMFTFSSTRSTFSSATTSG